MSDDQEQPRVPDEEELRGMSRDELVRLGTKMDGVEFAEYPEPWPVKGTRAERRSERLVAFWFGLAAFAALCMIVEFIAWPWKYQPPGDSFVYNLYTPLLGVSMGVTVLSLAFGAMVYAKRFVPHETAIQERHDGPSSPVDRATVTAELADSGHRSTIARRSMIKRTGGAAAGLLGLGLVIVPLGGFIKNPWDQPESPDSLWHTGWKKRYPGEKVFLRKDTGVPDEVALVGPADMAAGGMQTVFPFRESERDNKEELAKALERGDNPVMLFRFRPGDAEKVVKRHGQENFNYGDFYAYTKICSHLGCPVSLYEQQTQRALCPCHQSQFNMLVYGKPIFGPATRALAQLPIEVDQETGYFVARHDFIEAIGPAFWIRGRQS